MKKYAFVLCGLFVGVFITRSFTMNARCNTEGIVAYVAQEDMVSIDCCELMMMPGCSNPGNMPADTLFVCSNDSLFVQTQDFILQNEDILVYVLHTNWGLSLGTVLAYNNSGNFVANQIEGINFNQTYYISAMTGPDEDNDQFPDTGNSCTALSLGTPVVFLSDMLFDFELLGEFTDWQFFNCGVLREYSYVTGINASQNQFPISITTSGYLPDTVISQPSTYISIVTYNVYEDPYPDLLFTITNQYGCTQTYNYFGGINYEAPSYALMGLPKDTLFVCTQDSVLVGVTCFLSRDGIIDSWEELTGTPIQYFLTTAPVYNPTLYPILASNTTGIFTTNQVAEYTNTLLYIVATDPIYEPAEVLEADFIQEDYTPVVFLAPIQATMQATIMPMQPEMFTLEMVIGGGSPQYLQQGAYLICDSDTLLAEWNSNTQNASLTLGPYPIELLPEYNTFNLCVQDILNYCQATVLNVPVAPPCPLALQTNLHLCAGNNPLLLSDLFSPPGGVFSGINVQTNYFSPDSAGVYTITYCYNGCCTDMVIVVSTNTNAAGPNNYLNTCLYNLQMIDLSLLLTNAQSGGMWQVSPNSGCLPPNGSFSASQGVFYPPQNENCTYCFLYIVNSIDCPDDVAEICIETFMPPVLLPEQTSYILPTDTLTLSATYNPEGLYFNWSTGANTSTIQVSYADTALYTVTVTNAANCTAQTTITLLPDPGIGIGELTNTLSQQYIIFPNPTHQYINVVFPNGISYCYAYVYNLNGKLLFQNTLMKHQNQLSLGNLPNGSYLLRLADADSSAVFKIIVDK